MSHGYEGHITCSDGVDMQLETLYEKFDGKRCKGLIRKPKIFIIQACRGCKFFVNFDEFCNHIFSLINWC